MVGPVTIAADGTAVTAVSLGEQNLPGDRQPTALTTEAANQIMAYLAGQRSAFTVPMRPEGSAFQQEVWKAAANIPYGHTTTARALAETLGRPGSFRSVGAALRACLRLSDAANRGQRAHPAALRALFPAVVRRARFPLPAPSRAGCMHIRPL